MATKHELIQFIDGGLVIDVDVSPEQETVWLSQRQMSELFGVSTDNIGLHIQNILRSKELDSSTTEESSVVQNEGGRKIRRTIKIYNLVVDGCKRIGATLFLKYLDKNHILFKDHQNLISNSALVAITLMIAESNPKEKDVMVALVMNLLD